MLDGVRQEFKPVLSPSQPSFFGHSMVWLFYSGFVGIAYAIVVRGVLYLGRGKIKWGLHQR